MGRPGSATLLKALKSRHPRRIDLSLSRIETVLARLNAPETRLPPVIHIAGTNGKGSTLAFLEAIFRQAGLKVHTYTSPHLVRFSERIRLAGEDIGEIQLCDVLQRTSLACEDAPLTFFEATTAAAFLAFSEVPADVVLLETGLGGRLDATNVSEKPLLTLLTPISRDHADFLGNDLAGIAREKAGILKAKTPCFCAAQTEEASRVIRARAKEIKAPLYEEGRDWQVETTENGLRYRAGGIVLDLPPPALAGPHQVDNAGLALAAARHTSFQPGRSALAEGIKSAVWPARYHRLERGPLVEALPPGWEIRVDGAHNPAAARALSRTISSVEDSRPIYFIAGLLKTKDAGGIVTPLCGTAHKIRLVPIPGHACLSPETLSEIVRAEGFDSVATAGSVKLALEALIKEDPSPARVIVAGSLYLAGKVLEKNT